MTWQYKKFLKISCGVLVFKALLAALVLLAVYLHGISAFHTLWLGAELMPVDDTIRTQFDVKSERGLLVNYVVEHSPADRARLKRGDIFLNIDSLPIYAASDVQEVLKNKSYHDQVRLVYLRGGTVYSTKLVLDYRPANAGARNLRSGYNYELDLGDFIALAAMGLAAGVLSGMIGCGGGALKVSLLIIFFGFDIYLAKVVSLISCGFMSISSSQRHIAKGQVDLSALRYLIPSAIVGVLIGIGLSMLLDRHVLEFTLALFLVYSALDIAYQVYVSKRGLANGKANGEMPAKSRPHSVLIWAGLPLGVFSSVLGITGGVIGTPMQRFLRKTPIKTCVANTLATAVFVSLLGGGLLLIDGLFHEYFSFRTFVLVLLAVMPGSLIGGQLGARMFEQLSTNYVKAIYAVVVLFIAYKLMTAM